MSIHTTLKNLPSATSLQALADGLLPSDWLDGLMTDLYGLDHLHASLTALPVTFADLMTRDTSAPPLLGSLESQSLQCCLASRLQTRLANTGSTIFSLTWKTRDTPAGRQYCQRAASVPRINETAVSLVPYPWPTSKAIDGSKGTRSLEVALRECQRKGPNNELNVTVALTAWPTATTIDNNQVRGEGAAAGAPDRGTTLGGAVRLASWSTPTTRDHKDGQECENVPINSLLGRTVWLTSWNRPAASDGNGGKRPHPDTSMTGQHPSGRKVNMGLASQVHIGFLKTQPVRITASGLVLTGSDAGMVSSGQLNPAHSRWLMGFPPEWDDCAVTAMRSCRRLAPRSSAPSKKQSQMPSDLDELI